ncbi:hypothetical protein L6452_18927 [Arctium lappa]|uniref:Uncharacterized protein n=1 Tax=Arctium lappa TaxID=4217 RepID=A0ACB9B816_ARCLA|nr:hypothetical protein L6452_18927 [Arctium lappa]
MAFHSIGSLPNYLYDFDMFLIGAGSGGVRASRILAQYGAKKAGFLFEVGCRLEEKVGMRKMQVVDLNPKIVLNLESQLELVVAVSDGERMNSKTDSHGM